MYCMYANTHTYICTHTYAHTHAQTHTHTNTRTHTSLAPQIRGSDCGITYIFLVRSGMASQFC